MKIGIMGGTFNPLHIGHLILAQHAYEELKLDKILFMPSKIPPHRDEGSILPEEIRCEIISEAIKDNSVFELSDLELKRMKTTYTVDTLRELKEEGQLYFIMGADSFNSLEKWREPEEIFKLATIVVGIRKDLFSLDLEDLKQRYEEKYSGKIHLLSMPNMEVSATTIRQSFLEGRLIKYFTGYKTQEILDNHKEQVLKCWSRK